MTQLESGLKAIGEETSGTVSELRTRLIDALGLSTQDDGAPANAEEPPEQPDLPEHPILQQYALTPLRIRPSPPP